MVDSSLTFQLIYSDGSSGNSKELLWEFYPLALAPFAFGAPAEQVHLFLDKRLLNFSDDVLASGVQTVGSSSIETVPYFPASYENYFKMVYRAARSVGDAKTLPPCSFRIITGHAFSGFTGGHLQFGTRIVPFADFRSAVSHLTILDTCNSAHAVASLTGNFPLDNPRRFNSKYRARQVFVKDPNLPIACDANPHVCAFRIGIIGQHLKERFVLNDDVPGMSLPFGDSVTSSVISAVGEYIQQRGECRHSLDDLFVAKYRNLKKVYLAPDHTLKPFCNLQKLQELIDEQKMRINTAVFDCEMFHRQNEWFLTFERAVNLSFDQEDMAKDIVEFVSTWIISWHNKHPNSNVESLEAQEAWTKLARMMGPHRRMLTRVYIEQNETTRQIYVSTEDEGIEIESWALSCESLRDCIGPVSRKIETGSFDPFMEEGDDDEEEDYKSPTISQKSDGSGVVPALL
eukprot:scaffold2880_cov173-Amphora_coffeaeformis.AAC.7